MDPYYYSEGPFPLPAMSVVLPILCLTAILLEILPLILNLRNRNYGAVSLILWLGTVQFFYFINPLIWPRDNVDEWWDGTGLCDIEVRILIGAYVAVPGSALCILRRLARIMDTDRAVMFPSKAQRRWDAIVETSLCLGFPILLMVVYYVVQPIRYFIYTGAGCYPALQKSWPSIVLVSIWPVILGMINAALGIIIIYRVFHYRKNLGSIFSANSTTKSRFLRLLILSCIIVCGVLPFSIRETYVPYIGGLLPYSWAEVHSGWVVIPVPGGGSFPHWDSLSYAVCGYVVFAFFGTGQDAKVWYKSFLSSTRLSHRKSSGSQPLDKSGSKKSKTSSLSSMVSKFTFRKPGTGVSADVSAGDESVSSPVDDKNRIYRLSTFTFQSSTVPPTAMAEVPHEMV